MISSIRPRLALSASALAIAALLAACGDQIDAGDSIDGAAAPPYPGDGAVGLVEAPEAGDEMENVADATLDGGMAGQTPDYGEVAGPPRIVRSDQSNQPSHSDRPETTQP